MIANSRDWIPCRVRWEQDQPQIDWCYIGDIPFTAATFSETIARALERPFSAAFLRSTLIEELDRIDAQDPACLIFHLSRCGSETLAQNFRTMPGMTVFSQPPPIDSILSAQRVDWLRSLTRAIGRGRPQYALELDPWHALDLPLFCQAFPTTPWIFLYRDLAEVLASLAAQPAEWTIPGYLNAERFGFDPSTVEPGAINEYRARLLAGIMRGVLESGLLEPDGSRGQLMNDSQLNAEPEALKISPEIQALTDLHLTALYQQLESKRAHQKARPSGSALFF